MRRILALRHGQASAGSDDYDRLSERGIEQSRRFGRWLARRGDGPLVAVAGRMRRHRETLEALLAGAGLDPGDIEAEVDPGLDEFDHGAVFGAFVRLFPDRPEAAIAPRLWEAEPRQIVALIRAALLAWSAGELDRAVPEPWDAFAERVGAAGRRLAARAGGADLLVVSSGGVIAQLARIALDLPVAKAIELNIGLRNAALSEFLVDGDGLGLLSWNALPHLADAPELWTYY